MDLNFTSLLVVGNFVLLVAGMIGGYVAIRSSLARGALEIETRVKTALTAENTLLHAELVRVRRELAGIKLVLKQIGLTVEIDDGTVTLIDARPSRARRVTHVHLPDESDDEPA